MIFRVKSAGFLHEILRLDGIPWSATRHDRTDGSVTHLRGWTTYREYYRDEFVDASVHICVTGPSCRRPPLPRQMAPEHSLCHIGVVSYGRFCRLLFAKYLSELFLYRYFVYICHLWCWAFRQFERTKNTKLTL